MDAARSLALNFIAWKPEYDCAVDIINCQHQDTLAYLNSWYADIKLHREGIKNPAKYLSEKMKYLNHFCCQHLAFEEDVMTILATDFRFNEKSFLQHVKSHRHFSDSLLQNLTGQIGQFIKSGSIYLLDDLIVECLKDIAKWWFNHITNLDKNEVCHDHAYRLHMQNLTPEEKLRLLNEIISKAELEV